MRRIDQTTGRMRAAVLALTAGAWVLGASAASAQQGAQPAAEAAPITIELNKLEAQDGKCRTYLLFANHGETGYETFKLDLVILDKDGIIAKRLAVEAGPLRADKRTVKLFDIDDIACDDIAEMLLNDVLTCAAAAGAPAAGGDCVGRVALETRAVPFAK